MIHRFASVLVACLAFTLHARAQPQLVLQRLTDYGELSAAQAHALQKAVSKRMKRAVRRGQHDPVRAAVARAVLAANPSTRAKRSSAAQVRKRLRAGLDLWALEHVFASRDTTAEKCSRGFSLSTNLCDALIAAAEGAPRAAEPATATRPIARPSEERVLASIAPAPPSAAARAQAPIAAPPHQGRATPAVAPSPEEVAQRKAEYQRQRGAYLERRRAELEARRARILANAEGERAQRGPASELEAEVAGLAPDTAEEHGSSVQRASANADRPVVSKPVGAPASTPPSPKDNPDEVDSLVGDLLSN